MTEREPLQCPSGSEWGVRRIQGQKENVDNDAQGVPPEYEEGFSCAVTKHWDRLPREVKILIHWRYPRTSWT